MVSALDKAMEKHDECAPAISSSGLVRPAGCSARDAQVTSKSSRCDDSSCTRPLPSMRDPVQVVIAFREVAMWSREVPDLPPCSRPVVSREATAVVVFGRRR